MTSPLHPSGSPAPPAAVPAMPVGRGPSAVQHGPAPRAVPRPVAQPVLTQHLTCCWVPGTTNLVRLNFSDPAASGQVTEVPITHLSQLFGRQVLYDMYLVGRAQLRADPWQLARLRQMQSA